MRVHELAKEFQISTGSLQKHLKDLGIEVNSHMSQLEDDNVSKVRVFFQDKIDLSKKRAEEDRAYLETRRKEKQARGEERVAKKESEKVKVEAQENETTTAKPYSAVANESTKTELDDPNQIEKQKEYLKTIDGLYQSIALQDENFAIAKLLLTFTNWFMLINLYDPSTGYPLPQSLTSLLNNIRRQTDPLTLKKDRLIRIYDHSHICIKYLLSKMKDTIIRNHEMLPIYAIREVDSKTVQWLSMQTGRNLREKLAGKPYMKAVKRRFSFDTLENRVLKAVITRLIELLEKRVQAIPIRNEEMSQLVLLMQKWLRDQGSSIGHWRNLPPNNTLLADKYYKKIWDAWIWLQNLDSNITMDQDMLSDIILTYIYWNVLAALHLSSDIRFVEQPCPMGAIKLKIKPLQPIQAFYIPIDNKQSGKISQLFTDKGYGFILCGMDKYFFHRSVLTNYDFLLLTEGTLVCFDIAHTDKGYCAVNVHVPSLITLERTDDNLVFIINDKQITLTINDGSIEYYSKDYEQRYSIDYDNVLEIINKTIESLIGTVEVENTETNEKSSHAIINLTSIRPDYTIDPQSSQKLPFRLLSQYWYNEEHGELSLDCGKSKAIMISKEIKSISILDAFSEETKNRAIISKTIKGFVELIRDYLNSESLTYLVPDHIDDFSLDTLRKNINFYFSVSTPLPQSIAAIFAWHSSKRFEKDKVCENDIVLVINVFNGGVSITPVQARLTEKISEIIAETQGITWERHPTWTIRKGNNFSEMQNKLNQDGCVISAEMIRLFGIDGLISDAGSLSVLSHDSCYHIPNSVRDILIDDSTKTLVFGSDINKPLKSFNRKIKGPKVFVLPLYQTIKLSDIKYTNLGTTWNLIKGAQNLEKWQIIANEIPLWRDHLPILSFKDIPQPVSDKFFWWADFQLVKDSTIVPKRGEKVSIPVEESFILPAGKEFYKFPLQQGDGDHKSQFVAYLKSPVFPLKKDTVCKLKMTYTYGADDPYELRFIPLSEASTNFKSIRVEWRPAGDTKTVDSANLPVPVFPLRKSWFNFQKFPKEDGKEFSNLLDWVERKLTFLVTAHEQDGFYTLLNEIKTKRVSGSFMWGNKDKWGKYYCWVNVDGSDIFCHSNQFVEDINTELLYEGERVYLNLTSSEGRTSGEYVSFYEEFPVALEDKIKKLDSDYKNKLQKSIYDIRFPVLTIWNNGHSLSEPDVPDHFRKSILEGVKNALSIIESDDMPDSIKDELFFFFCCLHKDAPEYAIRRLRSLDGDKNMRNYSRHIGYAIGDAEIQWQKELLVRALTTSCKVDILAIALWRSKELIHKLTQKEIENLCSTLFKCVEFDVKRLTSDITENLIQWHVEKGLSNTEAIERERLYQTNTLCKHLELLLALLRTRDSKDEKIKMIFAPEEELTIQYVSLIDDLTKVVMHRGIKLKSRISLQVEKPEMFGNTPDLLYALRMYLTGDSGANTIVITGISDDDY